MDLTPYYGFEETCIFTGPAVRRSPFADDYPSPVQGLVRRRSSSGTAGAAAASAAFFDDANARGFALLRADEGRHYFLPHEPILNGARTCIR
jgi:hypothetical protein